MKRILFYSIFVILYVLVTFFGLGPALMADGTNKERLYTLIVVLMLYGILTIALLWLKRKSNE
ncbi:MAG: hypothetical protein CVV02_15355 [Firmicutes bacterium HGW-Firmicutes-7]|nr:MAG: hypothetical protein CVV02_15355 [Firmicutes bacterium HGW-Firmicutes-7]